MTEILNGEQNLANFGRIPGTRQDKRCIREMVLRQCLDKTRQGKEVEGESKEGSVPRRKGWPVLIY